MNTGVFGGPAEPGCQEMATGGAARRDTAHSKGVTLQAGERGALGSLTHTHLLVPRVGPGGPWTGSAFRTGAQSTGVPGTPRPVWPSAPSCPAWAREAQDAESRVCRYPSAPAASLRLITQFTLIPVPLIHTA